MLVQAVHPGQLVVELWARPGIAVGCVEIANENPADCRLDVATLAWVRVAGEAASRFHRRTYARQQRDPVPAALAVPDCLIAERLDRFAWKRLVGGLQLLQADDVRLEFLDPADEHREPRVDPVDVVARDADFALVGHQLTNPRGALPSAAPSPTVLSSDLPPDRINWRRIRTGTSGRLGYSCH